MQMSVQIQVTFVILVADRTFIFLFVNPVTSIDVVFQFVGYIKLLAALLAFYFRECRRMDSLDMHVESASRAEFLETILAIAFLIFGIMFVHPMHVKVVFIFEGLVANVTHYCGVLRRMHACGVEIQVLVIFELLRALLTYVALDPFGEHYRFPSGQDRLVHFPLLVREHRTGDTDEFHVLWRRFWVLLWLHFLERDGYY